MFNQQMPGQFPGQAPMNGYPMQMGQPGMGPAQNPTSQFPAQTSGVGNFMGNAQPGLKVRPVASFDEAKAVPTDFLGNVWVLPDFAHGFVYAKGFNPNTGSPILQVFQRVEVPETPPVPVETQQTPAPTAPAYDPKSDIESLKQELAHIKKELGMEEKKDES